jgi:anti-sigma regulatory factor (Ser/Thr protein kinase)
MSASANRASPDESSATVISELVDAGSLDAVRARIRQAGTRAGLTDLNLSKFVLAVHELAVNAVRHGGGTAEVRVWRDADLLRCEVTDRGRGIPRPFVEGRRRRSPDHLPRWGLWLVRQICPDISIETGRRGTRVAITYPIDDDAGR